MTYYGKVLDGLGSKKGPIKAAAKAAWAKVVPTLQPEAAPLEMKALYGASRGVRTASKSNKKPLTSS